MLIGYLVMCFIFGTTFLAIKIGLNEGLPPFWFAALRFFIAGSLVLVFLGRKKQFWNRSLRFYREVALIGLLMTTIPYAALFWAEQYVGSGLAAILAATSPLFTMWISVIIGHTRFRWYLAFGLVLGLLGLFFAVGWNQQDVGGDAFYTLAGKILIAAAELFYAMGAIRSKKLLKHISPFAFNGLQMLFSSVGLFILSFTFEKVRSVHYNAVALSTLFYLAIIASILALGIYYWLLKETNPTFPTTWTYVAPVLAMIVGAVFLGEKLTATNILGAICVLAGIIILNLDIWKQLVRKPKNQMDGAAGVVPKAKCQAPTTLHLD